MKPLIRNLCSTLALLCIANLPAAGAGLARNPPSSNATNEAPAVSTARRLTLPHFEPTMPVAPGRDEFMRACVTCHSPRYVTMQPPFSRRQWEDTVHKMVTAYGAPVDEFQVGKIVDYLNAIDGTGPGPAHDLSSDDDEIGATAGVAPPEATENAPVLEITANAWDREANVRRGAVVFQENCAGCHGADGRGNGVASLALLPNPIDLTAARFSDEFLRETLWNGRRGTSMPSWRVLPVRDLSAVAGYVQSLHSVADSNMVPPESLTAGSALFGKYCAACHGPTGDGKSPAAAALSPQPANLKMIQPDFNYILKVLREGIPGTAMPEWKDQLSESDRTTLAGYVRSLAEQPK